MLISPAFPDLIAHLIPFLLLVSDIYHFYLHSNALVLADSVAEIDLEGGEGGGGGGGAGDQPLVQYQGGTGGTGGQIVPGQFGGAGGAAAAQIVPANGHQFAPAQHLGPPK